MADERRALVAFNRGIISKLGLARIDFSRLQMAAETMVNWMPRVLGPMMLRPGLKYLSNTEDNEPARLLPFIFSFEDSATIEIADNPIAIGGGSFVRVRIDDVVLSRPVVTAAITNPLFSSDLSGWTDIDEGGTASTHNASGYMDLLGDGTNFAGRKQEVTVNEADVEHAIRVSVVLGPVVFKVGSTDGGDEYVIETLLGTGEHSLAFTPSGDFWIHLTSSLGSTVQVTKVDIEPVGQVTLGGPWAASDLPNVRYDQSGDIIFVACKRLQQRKIERRAARSWSVVKFEPVNGPFRIQNTSKTTMALSALDGDITITASKQYFRADMIGGLIRIASVGQKVSAAIAAQNVFTDPIRVTGADALRNFQLDITGTFVGTVTVQYSVGAIGAWVDLETHTGTISSTIDDGQDNQIIFYRVGIKTGEYTSGTATCVLTYGSGSITGVARLTSVSAGTSVGASVIKAFGQTTASTDWWEGIWSDYRGFPSAVGLDEGRLWFAGKDKIWGSESDQYESFDDQIEGDSGPISRNIGKGPIDTIHWLLSLGRLIIGTALNSANVEAADVTTGNQPISARSSSFGEPLTPTNFNLRFESGRGVFVDRSIQRLFLLAAESNQYSGGLNNYGFTDLSLLTPDLNSDGITRIVVQQKPDIRIHSIRNNAKASVLVFDRAEEVAAWIEIETDGDIEDAVVLPGAVEDKVYYVVKRVIDGSTVRFVERWALESEAQGGTLNKQADAFIEYSGAATTTLNGLSHLEGESVVVWGDGINHGTFIVSSGSITLTTAVSNAIIGLTYRAQFKGAKLGTLEGAGLNARRRLTSLGLVMLNTHHLGVKYGPSFNDLYDLPQVLDNIDVAVDTVHAEFDFDNFPYGGDWSPDSRLHLEANAPNPVTVQAATIWTDAA